MTKAEYIASIPYGTFCDQIHDMAQSNFERLWACGSVASDAMEEFNNDAIKHFEDEGLRQGLYTEES